MKGMVVILYLLVSITANCQIEKGMVRKGNADYKKGKYQEAEKEYRKALSTNPSSGYANYNLANTLYKQKQFDAAAREYAQLTEKEKDKEKLSQYYYNLGNTLYQNKEYPESVQAFKNALRNNPNDMDAKHNLQMALRMLKNQENNQNSSGKQNDPSNQQDKNQPDPSEEQNNDRNNPQAEADQQGQISREDANRILQAIENEEKEVMRKVQNQKEQAKKIPVEKDW